MLNPMEASQRWKKIIEYTNKITDPVLRESILAEYKQRAIDEWGFCPDKKEYKTKVELEPWQEQFLQKIKDGLEYGVFIKDPEVEKEAKARMKSFIQKGGSFSDLPKDLRNQHIAILYLETFLEEIQENQKILEESKKNT